MMIAINQATHSQTYPKTILATHKIETPIGPMMAMADENLLYFLHFTDDKDLDYKIKALIKKTNSTVTSKKADPLFSIEDELTRYFDGTLQEFTTPVCFIGTDFQKPTWHALSKIPYGTTRSYTDIATFIGKPSSCRGVARANITNPLAIIIPCHRVINANGNLGGYNGGISRKQWLLDHEKINRYKK